MTLTLDRPDVELMPMPQVDIACEWEDSPCSASAIVMCKGCADDAHRSLCRQHYNAIQQWFESVKPAVCSCGRAYVRFSTHYDVRELR